MSLSSENNADYLPPRRRQVFEIATDCILCLFTGLGLWGLSHFFVDIPAPENPWGILYQNHMIDVSFGSVLVSLILTLLMVRIATKWLAMLNGVICGSIVILALYLRLS